MVRLHQRRVDALEPRETAYDVRDDDLKGFGVRVLPSGGKRYFVHSQRDGRRVWKIVGKDIAEAEARARAKAVLAGIRSGTPPMERMSFEAVAEEVFERYGRNWKPRTLKVNRGYYKKQILPWFGERGIAEITRRDVQRCWAHKIRNVLDKVRKADQEAVRQDLHAVMNADNHTEARSAARRFAKRREDAYPKAVACLRNDLDDLLTCFRYKDPDQRRQVRTTNAIERREVRRRTRPMGAFQDRTSMDRILFAIFLHENKQQGISTLFPLTHKS